MSDKQQTILVAGGAGFIGTNVCLEARKRGYNVIAFDSFVRRGSEENMKVLKAHGVEICRGDVRSPLDLQRIGTIPHGIINFAANPGIPWSMAWPKYDFEVNTGGALNLLEYSRVMSEQVKRKIPVIFASTNKVYPDSINIIPLKEEESRYSYVYMDSLDLTERQILAGYDDYKGINENFPIDGFGEFAHSPYGCSKLAADQYHQEYFLKYGVPVVINRMSCVYGLFQKGVQDQGWIDHFVRQIGFGNGKLNFFGDGKQVRDMLFGSDVARLYLDEFENIEKVQGNIFNIGGGHLNTLSLLESVDIIEELSGRKAEITHLDWRHADQKVYISDITKVEEVLGWEPQVDPEEGIKRMLEFYREYGI